MQQKNLRRAAVAAVLVVLVLVALLLYLPTPGAGTKVGAAVGTTVPATNATLASADGRKAGIADLVTGPTAEELPKITPQCDTILEWHERNVPAWVIEDNMMAQGMKFDEADLACLTAGALPPQIVDFAEQNVRYPQPEPRKR